MREYFQEKYYDSPDGLKLYYRHYNGGDCDKPPLLCLHGLTRNSKDFDEFARHFSADRPVFSLDIRGRGKSQYDPNHNNYQIPIYVQDVLAFLAHEKIDRVITVGTSMGGLISMALGMVRPDIFTAIILNDIGPEIDPKGIERISGYVGGGIILHDWQQAINGVRIMNGSAFPDYSADDWEIFARNSYRQQQDGAIVADYDQNIGTAMRDHGENVAPLDLWPLFTALSHIPMMVLRGENSDILSPETVDRMTDIHPRLDAVTVPNRAHAPDLSEDVSLGEIQNFINNI